MSVLNFSLLRIFQGYLVICCLIINVLCFCCLATAILDYHISFRLSTTFFTFLNFYFFCFYRSIKCSDIIPCFLFVCQHLFSTFFKFLYQHFTFPENKRRRRDLNPRTARTVYTLSRGASSATWVLLQIHCIQFWIAFISDAFEIILYEFTFVNAFFHFFQLFILYLIKSTYLYFLLSLQR